MKVKVIRKYNDLELGKVLNEGTEIEVEKERAAYLQSLGYVQETKEKVKLEPKE